MRAAHHSIHYTKYPAKSSCTTASANWGFFGVFRSLDGETRCYLCSRVPFLGFSGLFERCPKETIPEDGSGTWRRAIRHDIRADVRAKNDRFSVVLLPLALTSYWGSLAG